MYMEIRTSYREEEKIKHKTIANLSNYSGEEIDAIDIVLKHKKELTQLCSVKEVNPKVELSVGTVWLLNSLDKAGTYL